MVVIMWISKKQWKGICGHIGLCATELADMKEKIGVIEARLDDAMNPDKITESLVRGMAKGSGIDDANWLSDGLASILTYDGNVQPSKH
jgi:hypothetical protein